MAGGRVVRRTYGVSSALSTASERYFADCREVAATGRAAARTLTSDTEIKPATPGIRTFTPHQQDHNQVNGESVPNITGFMVVNII